MGLYMETLLTQDQLGKFLLGAKLCHLGGLGPKFRAKLQLTKKEGCVHEQSFSLWQLGANFGQNSISWLVLTYEVWFQSKLIK